MGEQENLQTVQRVYGKFAQGEIPAMLKFVTDDVEWNFPPTYGGIPWAQRPWCGRDGGQQAFTLLTEALEFQVFQPDEFIVSPDTVVVLGHERCLVRATGRVVNANWAQIFSFRAGLICRFREYTDTAAWDTGFSKK
jgi:uncharacterized protein